MAKKSASPKASALIIVESPTKIRTLSRLLGDDYKIMASVGHIMDLPTKELGVDVESGFTPTYVTIKGKKKVITDLKKAAATVEKIFLAPDPDREGEAIAWHVANLLGRPDQDVFRITFDEITRRGVEQGLANPRKIDLHRFEAQQARRILDRLVGYKISPLLWKKVRRGLSAGRVQSVAVRLICERESAIRAFVPEEYWTIDARAEGPTPPPFALSLAKIQGEKIRIGNGEDAQAAVEAIGRDGLTVDKVESRDQRRHPAPPFITSTLQQEASRKLKFTAKRTMRVAQSLYEGVDLGKGEQIGLITYMRTDSTRIAGEALTMARDYIADTYPATHLPEKPNIYKTKKSAQDAHEAIRPTDVRLTPAMLKDKIEKDQYRLYELIWKRFVASQMTSAIFEQTRVEATPANADYLFVATGQVQKFQGFLALYEEGRDDVDEEESDKKRLPPLAQGDALQLLELVPNQHFTQPPPRFTEATLVRELESQGIGRPSTYASIISVIQDKEYVDRDKGRFTPTELGELTNGLLVENFPKIMDVGFTAQMEDKLDEVEEGNEKWQGLLATFYSDFETTLAEAARSMRNVKAEVQETDIACEKCGKMMVIKWGRNGKFLACPGYPECRNTRNLDENGQATAAPVETEPEVLDQQCPKCGSALVVKNSRRGRFAACPKYPECKHAESIRTGVACPRQGCEGQLVEKFSARNRSIFYSCDQWPKCKYSVPGKPLGGVACPRCGHAFLIEATTDDGVVHKCPVEGCGHVAPATQSSNSSSS